MQIVIVGAGIAGLTAANLLKEKGYNPLLIEATDAVGGRIKTDLVDGFLLDHGFQVFLDAYPFAKSIIDLKQLQLKRFESGALVHQSHKFHLIGDPFKHPKHLFPTLFAPVATLSDKLRVLQMRFALQNNLPQTDGTIAADFKNFWKFSDGFYDAFFAPFLKGVTLDQSLASHIQLAHFILQHFIKGSAALPALGMQAIPQQLARGLDIRFNTRVSKVENKRIHLDSGNVIVCDKVIFAHNEPPANQQKAPLATQCFYFTTPDIQTKRPMLMLEGENKGVINHLAILNHIQPTYAPNGQHLVAASTVGIKSDINAVKEHLRLWFGKSVENWECLNVYDIPKALWRTQNWNSQTMVSADKTQYFCGDVTTFGSIEGAMKSANTCVNQLLQDAS
jgi:Flavin containing amine oxidoreductase